MIAPRALGSSPVLSHFASSLTLSRAPVDSIADLLPKKMPRENVDLPGDESEIGRQQQH